MKKIKLGSMVTLFLMLASMHSFSESEKELKKFAPREEIERIVCEKNPELRANLLAGFLSSARKATIQNKANIPYKVLILDKRGIEMDQSTVGEHLANVGTIVISPGNERFKFPSFMLRDVDDKLVIAALAE